MSNTTTQSGTQLNAFEARKQELEALQEVTETETVNSKHTIGSILKRTVGLATTTVGVTVDIAGEVVDTTAQAVELLPSGIKRMKAYIRGSYIAARMQLTGYTQEELEQVDAMVSSLSEEKQQRLLEGDAVKNLQKLADYLKSL